MVSADIQELTEFLMEYSISMLSAGTYTSRVVKCVSRIGESFGYEVNMSVFPNSIAISVIAAHDYSKQRTYIRRYKEVNINFNTISLLSALSWHVYDEKITLKQLKKIYTKIINKDKFGYVNTMILVCIANAAFSKIFGGDFYSIPVVFCSTLIGVNIRKILTVIGIDYRLILMLCGFMASISAYLGSNMLNSQTPDVAIGTSVLFLIPGVHLINSIIDILDGYYLTGISRSISTLILISCIAIGLYVTISITGIMMAY